MRLHDSEAGADGQMLSLLLHRVEQQEHEALVDRDHLRHPTAPEG
jgi:hypothetical protein